MAEEEKPCPMCAGTGKVDIKEPYLDPFSASTHVVFDPITLANMKLMCGT